MRSRSARRERLDRLHGDRPALVPPVENLLSRQRRRHLELAVAVAVGLLAVARQEVAKPRSQVARRRAS